MAIQAIDLEASFEKGGTGFDNCTIVDTSGQPYLNRAMWNIGLEIYEALQSPEFPNIRENIQTGIESARYFVQTLLEPTVIELIVAGQMHIANLGDRDPVESWKDQDIVSKYLCFLQMMEQRVGHISLLAPPEVFDILGQPTASMIMARLDDAVISEFCDGAGLIENIQDINELFKHLKKPAYVDAIASQVGQIRAKAGADAANVQHKTNQRLVSEWLDANYRPGYKHADMAAEIEKLVAREYDTILKDITAWKKKRKR